jgi:hypothetical protein
MENVVLVCYWMKISLVENIIKQVVARGETRWLCTAFFSLPRASHNFKVNWHSIRILAYCASPVPAHCQAPIYSNAK